MKKLLLLTTIALSGTAACTNPEVEAGHEGYIYYTPLIFGKMEFRENLAGPSTTGVSWRLSTINIDMRAKSYKEDFQLLTAENLSVTFEVNTRLRLKPGKLELEIVSIGDELDVKVLDIDWNRERISLGLKQLLPYPWTDIDKKYPVGSRVRGKVVSITNYGAFIELEKGVEGLVHISEMSWTRNVRHPSKMVTLGDEVEAVVLKVDPQEEKISLGMKQIEEDPWHTLPEKYPIGTRLEGKVRNLTSFGAFVEIEPGIDGLVHISDMSWTKRIQHPSEVLRKADEVEVVVLSVDAENKRISLGLKQTQDDPWGSLVERFAVGTETKGTIVRMSEEGIVVDLGDEVEGFVPTSQIPVEGHSDPNEYLDEGLELSLRVTESDAVNRRIVLDVTERPEIRIKPKPEPVVEGGVEGEAAAEVEAPEAAIEAPAEEVDEAPADEAPAAPAAEADEAPADEAGEEPARE